MSHVTMSHVTNFRKKAIRLNGCSARFCGDSAENFGGSAANAGNAIAVDLFCVFRASESAMPCAFSREIDEEDKAMH